MLCLLLSYLIDSGIVVVSWFLRCACSAHRFVLTLKSLPVGNWKPGEIPTKELLTLISSFLDVLEEILAEDDAHQDGQEDSDEEMMESDEAEMNFVHYNKCISGEQFMSFFNEDHLLADYHCLSFAFIPF